MTGGRELLWKTVNGGIAVRIAEAGGRGTAYIDDRVFAFVLRDRDSSGGWLELEGKNRRFYLDRNRDDLTVWIDGHTYRLTKVQKGQPTEPSPANASGEVRALMPGKILRVDVAVGDHVKERQTVVTKESMKMESALVAPRAGTVTAVKCQLGQSVDMGELLVIIE